MNPSTTVSLNIKGKDFEAIASGDGQYDAFINAIRLIFNKQAKDIPDLTDYTRYEFLPAVTQTLYAKLLLLGKLKKKNSKPVDWTQIRPYRQLKRLKKC